MKNYKKIDLDVKKKKPGKQSAALILSLFKQAAALLKKKARFEDLKYYGDPEDYEWDVIERHPPKERLEYYLGGKHPDPYAYINYDDSDLQPEDFELKEPAFRFDPKEHVERGGTIVGKDDSPYVEDIGGKHYDIYKDDEDILDEDEGELDPLDEIHEDIPGFDVTKEDLEYLKEKNIDEREINKDLRNREDYESCEICGFDHSYEPKEAAEAHEEIEELETDLV